MIIIQTIAPPPQDNSSPWQGGGFLSNDIAISMQAGSYADFHNPCRPGFFSVRLFIFGLYGNRTGSNRESQTAISSTRAEPSAGSPDNAGGSCRSGYIRRTGEMLQFTAGGHALGFAADGVYATTGKYAVHVEFAGANSGKLQADSPASADGKAAPLSRVNYAELWDGITLADTAVAGSGYTTTYTLAPGANPADIRLGYNTPLTINDEGNLSIVFETGTLTESAPNAW